MSPDLTLVQASERCEVARKTRAEGNYPSDQKKQAKAARVSGNATTFEVSSVRLGDGNTGVPARSQAEAQAAA